MSKVCGTRLYATLYAELLWGYGGRFGESRLVLFLREVCVAGWVVSIVLTSVSARMTHLPFAATRPRRCADLWHAILTMYDCVSKECGRF